VVYEIAMPQLSDSMEEGTLISWKVKAGDEVKVGDVIADVESDKAIMEVQSFKDGVVRELKLKEGESALVGTVMAVIDTDKEFKKTVKPEVIDRPKEPISVKIEPIVTKNEGTASPKAKLEADKYGIEIKKLQKSGRLPTPAHKQEIEDFYIRRYFTPKALKLIDKYNLSFELFEKGKKYGEKDIFDFIEKENVPLPKPLTSRDKAVISTVIESAKKPVYHLYDEIDITKLKQFANKEANITVWFIKLIGEAMMQSDSFRTTLGTDEFQVFPNASISVAMADEDMLYMPVFKDVNKKSVREISQDLSSFKEKIKTKRFLPDDFKGSTFGISNLGMTGIREFDAMINRDDSGIAAIGSENGGKVAVTLTIDHRIINGFQSAEFMQRLKRLVLDRNFYRSAKD
jgi:pyruvate dehydrogenase E2 component (dihydrolipoamide acetyltransferase)